MAITGPERKKMYEIPRRQLERARGESSSVILLIFSLLFRCKFLRGSKCFLFLCRYQNRFENLRNVIREIITALCLFYMLFLRNASNVR